MNHGMRRGKEIPILPTKRYTEIVPDWRKTAYGKNYFRLKTMAKSEIIEKHDAALYKQFKQLEKVIG